MSHTAEEPNAATPTAQTPWRRRAPLARAGSTRPRAWRAGLALAPVLLSLCACRDLEETAARPGQTSTGSDAGTSSAPGTGESTGEPTASESSTGQSSTGQSSTPERDAGLDASVSDEGSSNDGSSSIPDPESGAQPSDSSGALDNEGGSPAVSDGDGSVTTKDWAGSVGEPCKLNADCRAGWCVEKTCEAADFELEQTFTLPPDLIGACGLSVAANGEDVLIQTFGYSAQQYPIVALLLNEQEEGWVVRSEFASVYDEIELTPGLEIDETTALIAPMHSSISEDAVSGTVLVYERQADDWLLTQHLLSPKPAAGGAFGWPMRLDGRYLLIGESLGPKQEGASNVVHLFEKQEETWRIRHTFASSKPDQEDGFGTALDANDGTAVITAKSSSPDVPGVAYVVDLTNPDATPIPLRPSVTTGGDWTGDSLALDGDTIALNVPRDAASPGTGSVVIFERTNATWEETQVLVPSNAESLRQDAPDAGTTQRGAGVLVLRGDTLLVGDSPNDRIYVFRKTRLGWQQTQLIESETPYLLGLTLALVQDTLVAGVPWMNPNQLPQGGVLFYRR